MVKIDNDSSKVVIKAFTLYDDEIVSIPLADAIECSISPNDDDTNAKTNAACEAIGKLIAILAAKGLMTADEVNEFISYPYSIES